MTTPLISTARIDFQYTVQGLLHHQRTYVKVVTLGVAGASTILGRDGATPHTLLNAAGDAAAVMDGVAPDDGGHYQAILETLVGTLWVARDAVSIVTGHGVVISPGWQTTLVMRMSDFTFTKFVLLEGDPGKLQHDNVPVAIPAPVQALINNLDGADGHTDGMFRWARGRSETPISASFPLIGYTSTPNRKLRRRRGLT